MPASQTKTQQTYNRILDAAVACYTDKGIGKTTLEEVAKLAGIGRTTLYRYVSNRDDLLSKVVLRDAQQQQEEMRVVTRYHDNLGDILVDSILHIMRGRRNRPINALLFGGSDDAVIDRINLSPENFYSMAEQIIAPQFEQAIAKGEIRDGVTQELASQWVTRVILSLITYPEGFLTDEDALRKFLRVFLVSSLIKDSS
ncbi:MAG: TetR/AcrR family transcriptional regulator [Gammaproteobacteria bacterium]|nr:TetR/AcrR family transcriptional regulator [Gammaproteobacteria bacterium]